QRRGGRLAARRALSPGVDRRDYRRCRFRTRDHGVPAAVHVADAALAGGDPERGGRRAAAAVLIRGRSGTPRARGGCISAGIDLELNPEMGFTMRRPLFAALKVRAVLAACIALTATSAEAQSTPQIDISDDTFQTIVQCLAGGDEIVMRSK